MLSNNQTLYGHYDMIGVKVTEIETEVNKMMTMGIVKLSKSPFCSPILLIKKTDGSLNQGETLLRVGLPAYS